MFSKPNNCFMSVQLNHVAGLRIVFLHSSTLTNKAILLTRAAPLSLGMKSA